MASNTTISRYRPALCVLAALAAGYTIYYIHSAHQASAASNEPRQRIRRRQANNRRRPRPAQIEELISNQTEETSYHDWPESVWDSKRLLDEWQACPDPLEEAYLLPQKYWRDRETPGSLLLRKEVMSLSWFMQEFRLCTEDAQYLLKDYEETLLRTFICQKVPPRCTLVDPGGPTMFPRAFSAASEGLSYPDVLLSIIQLFNIGAYDIWTIRRDTYARYHVRPPENLGDNMELNLERLQPIPGEQHIEYINDPEGFERLDEPPDTVDDVSESVHSGQEDDSDDNKKEGPQTLLNMLYHIAEDQARKEGFVHRGVSCKSCHSSPICGLRYKCINCVDFDLCETCEAMQQHAKTHLFLKIRVPAPAYTSTKRPQAVWYPGKAIGMRNLRSQPIKTLSETSGFTENEVEALWDQFKNLAATPWDADPLEICWAIDRTTFHKCFAISTSSGSGNYPMSLIYDRLFRSYDINQDGLVGFEEFILGMAVSRSRAAGPRMRRTFKGFDINEDGFISRKDVLAIFKACYAVSKDLARDIFAGYEVDLLDGGSLRDSITGNQPISSAFTGIYENADRFRRPGQGKIRDANGDLIIVDSGGVLSQDNDDEGDLDQIIGDLGEVSINGEYSDSTGFMRPRINTQTLISNIPSGRTVTELSFPDPLSAHLENLGTINDSSQPTTSEEANNNENDRRWTFFQERVADRNSRARFYDDENSQQADSIEHLPREQENAPLQSQLQNDSSAKLKNDLEVPLSTMGEELENIEFRTPPPMPEDIGQEMLFQITRECINELIDPLFKHREDLTLCAEQFQEFFKLCEEHLVTFKHAVTWEELDTEQSGTAMECLIWFHLHRYLKARAEGYMASSQKGQYPLAEFLQSMCDMKSPHFRNNVADKCMIHNHIKNNQEVSLVLNYPRDVQIDKVKAEASSAHRQDEGETQTTPSLSSDASQPEESQLEEPEIEYPAAAIELHETVRLFNESNTTLEENISKQSLDNLLRESGYSIITNDFSTAPPANTTSETPLDPTLPQNRPNTLPDTIATTISSPSNPHPDTISSQPSSGSGEPSSSSSTKLHHKIKLPDPFNPKSDKYIPSTPSEWSSEFEHFLHFLAVLQLAQKEDVERGGAGRINFAEYLDIVTGAAAAELEFLSQWIDMQGM